MSNVNIEEMDFDSMSIEELDSVLDEMEGKPTIESSDTEPSETNQSTEETIETSAESQEEVAEEAVKESEDKPAEATEGETDVEPQYQGKTREDLLEMQRNANRKISQQNNDLYQLKKKVEELSSLQAQAKQQEAESVSNDILKEYEPSDISAIETIVQRKLSEREAAVKQDEEAAKQRAMSHHDDMWDNLKVFNPTLFSKIESEAMEVMRNDLANTYHKEGWMKGFIAEKLQETGSVKPKAQPVVRKKVATVTGGGVSSSSATNLRQKSVDDMSPDEYLTHLKSQGISI